jgi:hypothetical protein
VIDEWRARTAAPAGSLLRAWKHHKEGTRGVPARYLIDHSLETNMDLYSVLATYALMDPSRVPGPATLALVVVALALFGLTVGRGRRRHR